MPAPSPRWGLVPVVWRGKHLDGSPATGTITLRPVAKRFVDSDPATPTLVMGTPIVLPIVNGIASGDVPATDDPDVEPTNFTYVITENITGMAASTPYMVEIPASTLPDGVDLTLAAPVEAYEGDVVLASLVSKADFDALTLEVTTSATGAGTYADASAASAVESAASADASATSADASAASAVESAASAGASATSANASDASALESDASADAAAGSATAAASSATQAGTSATNAQTSATNAASAANTAVTNHVAAADPHTQYLPKTGGKLPTASPSGATDFNTILTPGIYYNSSNAPNKPLAEGGFLTVIANGGIIHQEWATPGPTSPRLFVRKTVNNGATWSAWLEVRTSDPAAGNIVTGTGFPEGVVLAPAGTKYIDIAATNGAVEWIKTNGTGSTGWKVVYGDTGFRTLVSWNASGVILSGAFGSAAWGPSATNAGHVKIARRGDTVWCQMLWPTAVVANSSASMVDLASGFRGRGVTPTVAVAFGSAWNNVMLGQGASLYRHQGQTTAGDSFGRYTAQTICWPTSDPWPTTLPGIAE